jgi:hypothetical protein
MTNANAFDVVAYGKKYMKCNKSECVIRDVKVKDFKKNQLSIEVCCLNLTGRAATAVACARWEHGGEEAAIAAAIALPLALALGIGLPFLINKCRPEYYRSHAETDSFVGACYVPQTTKFDYSVEQCCKLCSRRKGNACLWAEGQNANELFEPAGGRQICSVCPAESVGEPVEFKPGTVFWYPVGYPWPIL